MGKRILFCLVICALVLGFSFHAALPDEAIYAFNQRNLARAHQVLREEEYPYYLYLPGGMILIKPQIDRL